MPFSTTGGRGRNIVPFYSGGQVPNPPNVILKAGAPSTGNIDNQVGTLYVDTTANAMYALVDVTGSTATWAVLGGGSSDVNTLTGDSGGAISPTGGTITLAGGTGIATSGSGSTITFNVVGGGLETTVSTTTPASPAVNTRLVTNTAGLFTVNLPAVAAVGSMLIVSGLGAGGWILDCAAGDTIESPGGSTSSGGTLASTNRYDSVTVVCVVADTTWVVESQMGVLTNA